MSNFRGTALNMKGDGFYDNHSQIQATVLLRLLPLLNESLTAVPLPPVGQPFHIVDYGCSEGKNSVFVVRKIIDVIRGRRSAQVFSVVHEDLPWNNFNRLFQQLDESQPYQSTDISPVYVFASANSFYSGVVPANSVHFAISSSAVHWTSKPPKITAHIYHSGANLDEQAAYAATAREDWQNFLLHRANEMLSNGRLIVTMAARVDSEGTEGGTRDTHSAQIILQLLNDILEQLVHEGQIDRSTLDAFAVPIYSRDKTEIERPIVDGPLKDALSFESLELEIIPCPFHEAYKIDGDAVKYATGLTGIVRAFTEPILMRGLFQIKERRRRDLAVSVEQQLADTVYERFQKAVLADPDGITFYPKHATLVLRKL